jgi:hypothetical protein
MGSVYSIAHHTIIYLGPSNERTDLFFSSLQSLSRYSTRSATDPRRALGKDLIVTLCDILKTDILARSWFTRIWVFQEFIFSRDPWVQCGRLRLQWENFLRFASIILEQSRPPALEVNEPEDSVGMKPMSEELGLSTWHPDSVPKIDGNKQLEYLQSARYRFQDYSRGTGKGNILLDILTSRRGLGVSDARDMIYAHIGLASDRSLGQPMFEVDYSKSASQVYTEVARYHLRKNKNYGILNHMEDVDPSKRRYGLPSWVPDWRSTLLHDPQDMHQPKNRKFPLPSFAFSVLENGRIQLVCEGQRLGRITRVGASIPFSPGLGRSAIKTAWNKYSVQNELLKIVEPSTAEMAFERGKEVYMLAM